MTVQPKRNRALTLMAKGTVKKGGNVAAQIMLDPDTFLEIRNSAIKQGISFAERVRDLVELGQETERLSLK